MIDPDGNYHAPCEWCGMDEMDTYRSFNSKDICIDCEDEALKETE